MTKFIIENRTEISDLEVMVLITRIVNKGKISNDNKQYCYATTLTIHSQDILIWNELNEKSHRFVIQNDK